MAFNVKKNWPLGGALEDSAKPKDGEGLVSGMFVKKDANGELVKADGSADEVAFMLVDNQDAFDVVESQRVPYIIGNAIVQTDQYEVDTYVPGDKLEVSAATPGKVRKATGGGAPTIGWVDGLETIEGLAMLTIIKPIPMGEAQ